MRTFRTRNYTNAEVAALALDIIKAVQRSEDLVLFEILHAAPEKTEAGALILADGSDFNPGEGAGFYQRNADNSAWVRLATLPEATSYARRFLLMGA